MTGQSVIKTINRILAVSDEPLFPHRTVSGTLVDILNVLASNNFEINLLQPGSNNWESNEKKIHVITFARKPPRLKGLFDILERKNESLFKAVASIGYPSFYQTLLKYAKLSDAILCYDVTYAIPTLLVAKLLKKPVILLGDIIYLNYFRKVKPASSLLLRFLVVWEKTVEQAVTNVVTWGQDDKNFLISTGVSPKKITVIPLSINLSNIELCSQKKNTEQQYTNLKTLKERGFKIIFFHGSLNYGPNKSAADYIATELAPALLKKRKDLVFAIVGRCQQEIQTVSNNPQVIFTGAVENIYSYIDLADIAIMPLFTGTGVKNKALEYFALSKPVITTKIGAENMTLHNNEECIITNIEDFPDKILSLLENPQLMAAMGLNGNQYVKANHQMKNYELYGDLAKKLN